MIHRRDRSLELSCLVSSLFYCGYYIAEQWFHPGIETVLPVITSLDGGLAYLLWMIRAPWAAVVLAFVDFGGGLVLLARPEWLGVNSAAFALAVNTLFVGSLTVAPLVDNFKREGDKPEQH